jgi:glycosyltransferase involved in cell wall biosynthesis
VATTENTFTVPQPLQIHAFTLTESDVVSEHVYAAKLGEALRDRDIEFVDDWRAADVVHLFEVNPYTVTALSEFQYPTLFQTLRSETPVVVSTDDLFFIDEPELTAKPWLYPLHHYTQRWLLGAVDAVIAISQSVKSSLSDYIDESKIHAIHHGVDETYRNTEPPDDPPFVLHVSLAAKRKNPRAVVEVARRLDRRFMIAGSGWDEHFRGVDNTSNVELLGYVPEGKLIDLYHRAAVFYFPTLHEGFGFPVLEAMAAGCAVVSSNVYSVPEVAGDAAVMFDPNDIDAYAAEINNLLTDDELRCQLVNKAIERSKSFTWERSAKETMTVYELIL